jgi:hypothetical protein
MVAIAQPRAAMGATPLAIRVVGNHFVNGAEQTIRLLGVDREGTEYACVDGTGYSVGPEDASDAAVIASSTRIVGLASTACPLTGPPPVTAR